MLITLTDTQAAAVRQVLDEAERWKDRTHTKEGGA